MFDQLMKRSNWVWVYTMGRFAKERRSFLCYLSSRGHSRLTLRNVNRLLLVIAERVNVWQRKPITERQIARAAKHWVEKSCAPSSTTETREIQTRRFVSVAKNWLRFLSKWRDPIRNPQFKLELDSFLKELRDERGYTDETLSTRETALNVFFDWLGQQRSLRVPISGLPMSTLPAAQSKKKGVWWIGRLRAVISPLLKARL